MNAAPTVPSRPDRAVGTGDIGLAQSSYGQRGNLELVAPDSTSGFLVFWCNGDDEPASGVAPRSWSAGLHVDTGGRVDGVRIAEVPHGPRFLEATILQRGVAERWTWRPDLGFVPGGPIALSTCTPSAVLAHDGAVHALTADGGSVRHHVAEVDEYPTLRWQIRSTFAEAETVTSLQLARQAGRLVAIVTAGGSVVLHDLAAPDAVPSRDPRQRWVSASIAGSALIGLDLDARLRGAEVEPDATFEAVAATRSSLDGGALEIVGVRHGALWHARVRDTGPARFSPIQRAQP